MTTRASDLVELEVIRITQTDLAMLVRSDMGRAWIPFSAMEFEEGRAYSQVTIELPEALAIEKGLV